MAQPRPRSVLADRLSVPAVRVSGRRARPRPLPRPARPASLLAALIVRVDRAPPLRLLAGPRTDQAASLAYEHASGGTRKMTWAVSSC